MADLIARCRNTPDPCPFEVVCHSEQHKERVEAAHLERRHDMTVTPEAVCDEMWTSHADERTLIIKAIEATALVNKGQVDMNVVRQIIPTAVTPQLIGAVINVLLRQGRLERIGFTTNLDKRGRNQGKPLPLYAIVGEPKVQA